MTEFTSYFNLCESLSDAGMTTINPSLPEQKSYTDAELLDALNALLECIHTLDDYEQLIQILQELEGSITLRFIYVFFQALVVIEQRLFKTQNMDPPVADFMKQKQSLLLNDYAAFCYEYEKLMIDWARSNSYDQDQNKWAFIVRRNRIYADYVVFAGQIIGVVPKE